MNVVLGDMMWHEHMKALMPEIVKVIGRVIGTVSIKDIGRDINYNQTVDISIGEANRSKDLLDALKKNWVEIIQGRELVQNILYSSDRPEIQPQILQQQNTAINPNEIKQLVEQSAKNAVAASMAVFLEEMKKLQSNNTISADAVNSIVNQIVEKLPTVVTKDGKIKVDDLAESVFIDLNDNRELQTNIEGGLGKVTTQEGTKAKVAINKLKMIKEK
ncbi:MAG: hypothetical protein Q7R33_02030 [Nitrosarchaeum sp.]|nr:hypothetical protein [Nitrosarchaeum sp.]